MADFRWRRRSGVLQAEASYHGTEKGAERTFLLERLLIKEGCVWFLVAFLGLPFAVPVVPGFGTQTWADDSLTVNTTALTGLHYAVPENPNDRKYLGLTTQEKFALGDVQARFLLVEIFSMYCPICQAEASKVNELYHKVQTDSTLRTTVKFLGIGARNTPFEVNVFRKKFSVPFPLLADDDFVFQQAVTETLRTPTFLVLEVSGNKMARVIATHVGPIQDPDKFLKVLSDAQATSTK